MAKAFSSAQSGRPKGRRSLLGKKIGMTQVFADSGERLPVTVLQVGPCTVLQVKTPEADGYSAVQLGFEDTTKKKKRPQQAYLDRCGLRGKRWVREVPFVDPEALLSPSGSPAGDAAASTGDGGQEDGGQEDGGQEAEVSKETENEGESAPKIAIGAQVGVSVFKDIARVDIRGVTKGRGFQGNIRRHGYSSGDKSHGSKNVRQSKSTGMHTDPGRVFKGRPMPGHMGAVNRKARNLTVVKLNEEDNLLLVAGSVPGPNGGYVYIEESLR
jgi:large subunit ribosomal protein L3